MNNYPTSLNPDSWIEKWQSQASEILRLLNLPPPYQESHFSGHGTSQVVTQSLHAPHSDAERLFLEAVAASQTHTDLIRAVIPSVQGHSPPIISQHIALLLRYSESIDKVFDSLGNTCFPAAIVFAVIRFMMSYVIKEYRLFISMERHFQEVSLRLRRLDVYLVMNTPTEAVKLMLSKVRIDILRFTVLATVFLKCTFP